MRPGWTQNADGQYRYENPLTGYAGCIVPVRTYNGALLYEYWVASPHGVFSRGRNETLEQSQTLIEVLVEAK